MTTITGRSYYPLNDEEYSLTITDSTEGLIRDDICRIIGVGSTIIGQNLYISGGVWTLNTVNADGTSGFKNDLNNRVLSLPLDKEFAWNQLSMTSTTKPNDVPSLHLEAVTHPIQDSTKFYSLNGVYQDKSVSSPFKYEDASAAKYQYPPNKYTQIFSYDTATGKWQQEEMKGDNIRRVASGQYTDDYVRGISYYLDGSTGADQDAEIKDGSWITYPALIEYNFNTNTLRNITHDMKPRQRGMLNYIPAGEQGMLISFGGRWLEGGIKNPTGGTNSLGEIYVFDIATEKWYLQKALGAKIPGGRQVSCSVVQSAPDGSSHNVYMFSGSTSFFEGGTKFQDLWVLSIPSFTWIKVFDYTGSTGSAYHRCHAYGNSMIITSGYREPTPISSGSNCSRLVSSLDLTTGVWHNSTSLNTILPSGASTPFSVPSYITDVIGGTSSGGSTITKPQAGFTWPQLEEAFSRPFNTTAISSSPNPTSSSSPSLSNSANSPGSTTTSSSLSPGTIAGIAVGSTLGAILALLALWFLLRQRRASRTGDVPMAALGISGDNAFLPVGSSSAVDVKTAPPVGVGEMAGSDPGDREKFGGHYQAGVAAQGKYSDHGYSEADSRFFSEVDAGNMVRGELDGYAPAGVVPAGVRELVGSPVQEAKKYHELEAEGVAREMDAGQEGYDGRRG